MPMPLPQFTEILIRDLYHDTPEDQRPSATELIRALRQQGAECVRGKPGLNGGGPDITPFNTAFVVLSQLVGGSRPGIFLRTWGAWNLPTEGTSTLVLGDEKPVFRPCMLTGQVTFGEALKRICGDTTLAARVESLVVKDSPEARIYLRDNDGVQIFKREAQRYPMLVTSREIDGTILKTIASMFKTFTEAELAKMREAEAELAKMREDLARKHATMITDPTE